MISNYVKGRMESVLGKLIAVATNAHIAGETTQKFFVESKYNEMIEKSDYSFINYDDEIIIEDILNVKIRHSNYDDISLWCGYAYWNLFLLTKKPLDYIFLYLPIGILKSMFFVYHEMPISELADEFSDRCRRASLLLTLIRKRHLTKDKLALLSTISINTIKKYCLSDETLYNASYENIYLLARSLFVREKLFIRQLRIADGSIDAIINSETLQKKFGLYLIDFILGSLQEKSYDFGEYKNNVFFSENDYLSSSDSNKVLISFDDTKIKGDKVFVIKDNTVISKKNNKIHEIDQQKYDLMIDNILLK